MYFAGNSNQGIQEIHSLEVETAELAIDRTEEFFENYFIILEEEGDLDRDELLSDLKREGFVWIYDGKEDLLCISDSQERINAEFLILG